MRDHRRVELTLVVLAAGLGSRFGGDKQLVDIGPAGETLLDYSIEDARRAGFTRVVLVVRTDIEDLVVGQVRRFHGDLDVVPVRQDAFGPPREKPWGTAHAVLACADAVPGRFGVVNADDFYGCASFDLLAGFLRSSASEDDYAVVGFEIDHTLSPRGSVTRGVLQVDDDGWLARLSEERGVRREPGVGIVTDSAPDAPLDPTTPVSMNMWGLTPGLFPRLASGFDAYRRAHAGDEKAEYLLPDAIADLVAAQEVRVRVLRSDAPWFGLTHADDLPEVRERMAAMVAAGEYPADLAAGRGG